MGGAVERVQDADGGHVVGAHDGRGQRIERDKLSSMAAMPPSMVWLPSTMCLGGNSEAQLGHGLEESVAPRNGGAQARAGR